MSKEITLVTCVGVLTKNFPISSGNCFSVVAENDKSYRIVNFVHENMEELFRRGFKAPFKIAVIGKNTAIVHDERIPDRWYQDRYCEVCCPSELLPVNQRMAHLRHIECGYRTEYETWVTFNPSRKPKDFDAPEEIK